MTDNINPSHYKDGPFERIELTRLLSFDWGNVVKYCYRWQSKNGIEDLKKALWYANDAVIHGIPLYADTNLSGLCNALFSALAETDWAGLRGIWWVFANNRSKQEIREVLKNKIVKIEKEGK